MHKITCFVDEKNSDFENQIVDFMETHNTIKRWMTRVEGWRIAVILYEEN